MFYTSPNSYVTSVPISEYIWGDTSAFYTCSLGQANPNNGMIQLTATLVDTTEPQMWVKNFAVGSQDPILDNNEQIWNVSESITWSP
jgi:hypothetical protein